MALLNWAFLAAILRGSTVLRDRSLFTALPGIFAISRGLSLFRTTAGLNFDLVLASVEISPLEEDDRMAASPPSSGISTRNRFF